MLLRRWSTGVDLCRAEEYEAFAANVSLPMFQSHGGLVGVVMSRDGAACLVETIWEDEKSIRSLETSPLYQATVADIQAKGFLRGEHSVDVRGVHAAYWSASALVFVGRTRGRA